MKTRQEIAKREENILKEYENTLDISLLEQICPMPVAHTIDVIFKEAIRTWKNDDLSLGTDDNGNFTGSFETDYELFNPNLVFFGNDYAGLWSFPITIYKDKKDHLKTDWENHNWFYPERHEYIDEDGLIYNFRQDIDIFGTEETWQWDLIKSLYMVVYAVYKYWIQIKDE